MTATPQLTAIGCTGPIGRVFVDGLTQQGVSLRVLARDPKTVANHHPTVQTSAGSIMEARDVATALEGVDTALVVTPMGLRDDPSLEIAAAKAVLGGAKTAGLKHLIYTSVLNASERGKVGVGVLDAKFEIERLIRESGVPHTILRTGSYMEDVFDTREALLRKGSFLFPVTKTRRFNYTRQADLPPFVAQYLLGGDRALNSAFNFVSPGTYSVKQVEAVLSLAAGLNVKATPKFPTYYMFLAMLPLFNLQGDRFSSIIPLIRYFDGHGYEAVGPSVADLYPAFRTTTLETHLEKLLG